MTRRCAAAMNDEGALHSFIAAPGGVIASAASIHPSLMA
jgi:hypothetical protein